MRDKSPSLTALVLCGGKGTRLRSVVSGRPKFLMPLADRPYADYLLRYLRKESVSDVVLCTGHLAEQVRDYCGDGSRWGLKIRYSDEPAPLGTGGAVKRAQSSLEISDPFWVVNGDSLVAANLDRVRSFHVEQGAMVTLVVAESPDVSRFGAVVLNADGSVRSFAEKAHLGRGYVNAGISVMSQSILKGIPPKRPVSLERHVLTRLVGRGLYGYVVRGFFIDIGTKESFRLAQTLLARWPTSAGP